MGTGIILSGMQREDLGKNWQSALCVTSLYDSYIQLQQENEALKEDATKFQRENEMLVVQTKQSKLRDPEDTKFEEFQQEIRLLRSEKSRMEEGHRLQLKQLQLQVVNSEAAHQQVLTKYNEKLAFDPLESKRASMAVKTMQNSLHNALLEKENIGVRYGELKEQYLKFQAEQKQIVDKLKEQVRVFQVQRVKTGQQRVVNALAQWSANKMQNSWNQWLKVVEAERTQEKQQQVVICIEKKMDNRVLKIQKSHAVMLAMKPLQGSARRVFLRWRYWIRQKVERRRKQQEFIAERERKGMQQVMARWKQQYHKAIAQRASLQKLGRVMRLHLRRDGMRRWGIHIFRLAIAERDRQVNELKQMLAAQSKQMMGLKNELEVAEDTRKIIVARHEEQQATHTANIEMHRAAELAIRQKLGQFFTKQSDRQLLKCSLLEWKATAKALKRIHQRSDLVQNNLRQIKLQRSVQHWRVTAHQTHTKHARTQHILHRMKQLNVLRCFNSWKESFYENKIRKESLLRAVNRMRIQGVARCFTQWRAFQEQRVMVRQGVNVMEKYALKQQTYFMFSSWKERVTELKIAAQIRQQELIQQAWENRLSQAKRELNFKRECFTKWHELILRRERLNFVMKKCAGRLKNGLLARILTSWCEFVSDRKSQRELVKQWLSRCYTGVLQHAWNRWQRQIVLREQQLLLLRVQGEKEDQLRQLNLEFDEYRQAQIVLLERAGQAHALQECKLLETEARLQKISKRALRFSGAVEALCTSRERNTTLLRCFKAWQCVIRRSIQNTRTVHEFQVLLETRQIRNVLMGWSRYATTRKRLRAVFLTVESCFSSWWKMRCFDALKAARQRSNAIRVFSLLFARNSDAFTCREVFTEWHKLAKKNKLLRRTLEQIWLGSVHAKMRQQFLHWVAFTKAEAAKEQVEKRNVALTAIRAKVWWKRSMSSMRFCFSEWKEHVLARKRQRQGERKLRHFQQTRLVMICFSAWSEMVVREAEDQERKRKLAKWLYKMQHRKVAQALALWKMLVIRLQQRDLQELNLLRHCQDEELQNRKEEIAKLKETVAETQRQLDDIVVDHDTSVKNVQSLTQYGLIAKYFNALKQSVSMARFQAQTAYFCHENIKRRQLAELFSSWYSYSQRCREIKMSVAQNFQRGHDIFSRSVLRQWHKASCEQRILKQKVLKIQRRARVRLKAKIFMEWCRSIQLEKNACTVMDILEPVLRRIQLKRSLVRWHQQCLQEKNRDTMEKEKQRRIMQFFIGRQEAGLVRLFYSWKEWTLSKQEIRLQAEQRFSKKRYALLLKYFQCWHVSLQAFTLQRTALHRLQAMTKRYYSRITLSRWKRCCFVSQIAILETGNALLTQQIIESNHQLRSSTFNEEQLSVKLTELQKKLSEADFKASTSNVEMMTLDAKRSRQLSCAHILSKIMMNRMVSKEVSGAFAHWKAYVLDLQQKHRALATVIMIRQRRNRWLAFWKWKVKTLRWRQLDSVRKIFTQSDQRSIIARWRTYAVTQAKLRLFLIKRCIISESNRSSPISIAFRRWKNRSVELASLQQIAVLHDKLRQEQSSSSAHLRRLALGKWCWMAYNHRMRQMRAFLSRCHADSTKRIAIVHRQAIEEIQSVNDATLAKTKQESEAQVQEQISAMSSAEEQLTTGASFQALQTLIRRLFQPTTVKDLFVSVSSTFAQILNGSSAVLFLFDPSSNELWTQREENQLIQVPASLGIPGSTLSSGSTITIADVAADPRFHPMVDQFVLSGLRQDDASALMFAASRPTAKSTVGMVSSALVSSDGAVYGVLQVAFPSSSHSPVERRVLMTQTQLYSKTCCFYVEQILFEMLRNCRDRVRARSPEIFIKLFKQNKNWRQYYAAVERKASEMEGKLREVLDEREELIQSKAALQKRYLQAKDRVDSSDSSTKDLNKLILGWKKKMAKWQSILDEKDRAIADKTDELAKLQREFDRYRRDRRSKDLQAVLNTPSGSPRGSKNQDECSETISDRGQLSLLRADQTRLKSQLVRAEADNLLLVKAISIARSQHGELPRTIQAEVSRVATRVSRRSPPQA